MLYDRPQRKKGSRTKKGAPSCLNLCPLPMTTHFITFPHILTEVSLVFVLTEVVVSSTVHQGEVVYRSPEIRRQKWRLDCPGSLFHTTACLHTHLLSHGSVHPPILLLDTDNWLALFTSAQGLARGPHCHPGDFTSWVDRINLNF